MRTPFLVAVTNAFGLALCANVPRLGLGSSARKMQSLVSMDFPSFLRRGFVPILSRMMINYRCSSFVDFSGIEKTDKKPARDHVVF